ncbi:hypothetical protein NTE_02099 [Candidatus Nitrososphaera evergladensis SR1]|uniref:Uncharacterized protein n=1 Tax=Candidatus Nitrososphaera evergladensis SR1 TaxID=1459636 RepID=A0A075MXZ4_9ARCH|nr:hypothetical protein [Candidatus Nitrososphaera evergladensis]AIF84154.1 hypothetical protein NTE_02099 [Candidatus Nitrososphaera evergladensis SR1]
MITDKQAEMAVSKHKNFGIIAILLTAALVGLTYTYFGDIKSASGFDVYAFDFNILVAVSLGFYFWYLQKQDGDKLQKVANEIREHIEQQRQIQDSIRLNSLNGIKVSLAYTGTTIEHIMKEVVKKQSNTNDLIATAEYLDHLLVIYHSLKPPVDSTLQQLAILRPYIRGEFANKIESVTKHIRYTGLASGDESNDGRPFAVESQGTVMQWLRFAKETIDKIDQLDKEIQDYKP